MTIGEVARQLGIPASTIRYYETIGLIGHPQRVSGRRQFDDHTLVTLRVIRLAQAAGFTLGEIKSLYAYATRERRPSQVWKPFVKSKHAEIQQRIAALYDMERTLARLSKCTCASFTACIHRLPAV